MNQSIESIVRKVSGAERVCGAEVLQTLWSGYGSIVRYRLEGAEWPSVIVKHVSPPTDASHPRGWNTDISHERKLRSYEVETRWYREYANRCQRGCRVPHCIAVEKEGDEVVLIMEDLDASGYSVRRATVGEMELRACLSWLAEFHAQFLGEVPNGLWKSGTYWHLETRPDELKVLADEDPELFAAAEAIDHQLRASPFQTWVHGDAKLANFCFAESGEAVAAVDFQYVGGGCGMKDVAYFVGSCLNEEECAAAESRVLDFYFQRLREAVQEQGKEIDPEALEADWRPLYPVAWTDFHRFLKGWSPGHWKIHGYSERLSRSVMANLVNRRGQ